MLDQYPNHLRGHGPVCACQIGDLLLGGWSTLLLKPTRAGAAGVNPPTGLS
jgi:hypothetical protein